MGSDKVTDYNPAEGDSFIYCEISQKKSHCRWPFISWFKRIYPF
jgi:hypothetical protein